MGVRAILDAVISEKIGDPRSFKAGVDGLPKASYVSSRQRTMTDLVLEARHATIQRGWLLVFRPCPVRRNDDQKKSSTSEIVPLSCMISMARVGGFPNLLPPSG